MSEAVIPTIQCVKWICNSKDSMIFRCVKKGWINWCVDFKSCVFFYKLRYLNFFINWEFVATTGPQLCEIWITLQIRPSVDLQETTCHQNWPTHSHWRAHSSDNIHSTVRLPTPTKSHQPITQAFSSCLHDLACNFVTSPNGILQVSFSDITTFCTKSSRVNGRRMPGH